MLSLSAGLLKRRGGLIATNFLPHVDVMPPLQTYHDALPSGSVGILYQFIAIYIKCTQFVLLLYQIELILY